jgi:hypothetical protein
MAEAKTITWCSACKQMVELEIPASAVHGRNGATAWFAPDEPKHQAVDDALNEVSDRLAAERARLDQLDAEMDALVHR